MRHLLIAAILFSGGVVLGRSMPNRLPPSRRCVNEPGGIPNCSHEGCVCKYGDGCDSSNGCKPAEETVASCCAK